MMSPEAQAQWMKMSVGNAMGIIMAATRAIGWNEEDFLDKWLVDSAAASDELSERIDEFYEDAAVEQLRRQLDEEA